MSQQQTQRLVIAMPQLQWSLVQAYQIGFGKPPPYKEPTFEEEEFTPRLKLELRRIPGFENLDHVARLRVVDEANEVFRFAYTRGRGEDDGRTLGYFKIPLLRNRNVEPDEIKIRMSAAEYERATAILSAVGEMERIARAVPYYGLYRSVRKHLKRMGGIPLEQTVLVSVDRGGRIPCTILQRALGLPTMLSLKVNQGGNGDGLDQDKLAEFAESGALRGKYVLFVDSTVDSGRQINALKKFFDPWCSRIGFSMWSIVGSNEYGKNLDSKHSDINWGVDPDNTFEDKPELMGIDYAPGSYEKVVECPSDASRAIRACLLAVPDGYVYAANDIDAQIDRQRKEWAKRQKQRRIAHRKLVRKERSAHRKETQEWRAEKKRVTAADRLERELERITASRRWQDLVPSFAELPDADDLPPPSSASAERRGSVLVVGNGKRNLPESAAAFLADGLALHCSLLAGTPDGNPGALLQTALQRHPTAEVRLYQPEHSRRSDDLPFGSFPVTFVGPEKEDMRRRMVSDSNAVLVLGGATGTMRETLLALQMKKPVYVIEGYGAVAEYLLSEKGLRKKPQVIVCKDLPSAVQKIVDQLNA